MKLVVPVLITDATLISSSVPENDYPVWQAGTTYPKLSRVIWAHRIYESMIDGNVGHDPAAGGSEWLDVGPTNRWAMFVPSAGPRTTSGTPIVVTIAPEEPVDALGLVDVDAASVRVQVTIGGDLHYDETQADGAFAPTFLDLPAQPGQSITVTITPWAESDAAVGKLVIGDAFDLGETESGPTISITDFSRRETDDFGVTTIVPRGWARRVALRTRIDSAVADEVQRRVVAVRATPALWIGEEGFEALTVYGFYKDFSVVLALGAVTFCSLTIEGLPSAEPAGPLVDPAPGRASDFKVVRPLPVTSDVLYDSSVAEDDYPQWTSVTTYQIGARVLRGATHRVFESVVANNTGNDPALGAPQWLDIGPTNRWSMFDQALGSYTTATGAIIVELRPGVPINALAVLDTNAATVRVQAPGYDRTQSTLVDGAKLTTLLFLDLATASDATVTVTISAASPGTSVSVGTLLIGNVEPLGVTETAPTVGINDYSRKEADAFGNTVPVERAWAKRVQARALVATDAVEGLVRRMASLRAKPALWIAEEGFDCLTIYGFFRDFSVEVVTPVSISAVTIEGLTTAAAIPVATIDWTNVADNDPENHPKPQDGATVGAPPGTIVGDLPSEEVSDAVKGADGNVLPARVLQQEIAAAQTEIVGVKGEIDTVRDDLAAEVARAEADTASIRVVQEQLQEGLAGNTAAIQLEQTTRANADSALANRATTLETKMVEAEAAITDEATVRAAADNALASRTTTLETRMSSAEAGITDEATVRASADSALASRATTLETRMGTAEADISEEAIVRANADSALASRATSLETRMGSAEADITEEATVRANADSALASRATSLETRMGSAEADISEEATVRANADSALASRATTLETRMGSAESAISTEASTRASADSALATRATNLEVTVNSGTTGNVALRARIAAEETARADGDGALASQISTVSTTVDGHTATLTTYGASINGLLVRYGVTLDANGYVTGFEQNNDGVSGSFTINADNFSVVKPGGGQRLEWSNGSLKVYYSNGVVAAEMGVWA